VEEGCPVDESYPFVGLSIAIDAMLSILKFRSAADAET